MNDNNAHTKIEALRKREAALKAAIAAEQARQQKTRLKLQAREFSAVGEALCKYAGQSPDFKLMLKQILASAALDEASRRFLSGRGWL
jgi:hypothetical protein